jgi:hypothetical protein
MTEALDVQEQSARRFLGIAATLGVVGIAFNLNGDGTLPKLLVGAGLIALVWSIHRFGRLGPDAPISFAAPEPTAAKKKKKKKKKPVDETPAAEADSESNDGM